MLEQPTNQNKVPQETEFLNALDAYNSEFGMGAMMAKSIQESLGEKVAPKITAREIREKFSAFNSHTGISLEPQLSKTWKGFKSDENETKEIEGRVMRLNINDGEQFVQYLKSITGKPTQPERDFLLRVSRTLVEQFLDEYDLGDIEDNRWVELFGKLEAITQEYDRLGIHDTEIHSPEKLKEYLIASRNGYLKEKLLAENANLFAPIGGFMWQWYKDSTLDRYENKYWKEVLSALATIAENKNAQGLLQEIKGRALEAVKVSREDIPKREYLQKRGEVNEFLTVLDRVEDELIAIK